MKQWLKKLVSGLSAAAVMIASAGAMPEGVFDAFNIAARAAVDENGFDIQNGVLKKYSGNATEVTIPDNVTSIGSAFYNCSNLTSITIPDSVISIGKSAFYGCKSLKSITIPDSVTSIGNQAFYDCDRLTSITISNSVASIGSQVFYNCTSLTSITIPDSVTSIGTYAFHGCTSLTNITIPDSVTSIDSSAIYDCTSLERIDVDESNKSYCSDNGILFSKDKSKLICYPAGKKDKTYIVPDSVTSIGDYAFYSRTSLTSITIPDSVISIGKSAFSDCTSLTSITIPDSVTSIGSYAFYNCSSLTSINIPDSVTNIDWISGCTSLKSITIHDCVAPISGSIFMYFTSLESIDVDESNKSYSSDNGVLFSKDKSKLIRYPAGKKDKTYIIPDSVTSIGDYAFYSCTSLTSITIPDGVKSIGISAFYHCSSLTSITIPDSVTSIGNYAFCKCYSLADIKISKGVSSIGYYGAFYGCKSLTSITIPDGVTSIGEEAFKNCSNLESITIPDAVTSIGWEAFYNCSNLKDIYYTGTESQWSAIKKSNARIPENCTIHFNNGFDIQNGVLKDYSGNATEVTIPDNVTSIGYQAFIYCTSLTSITIPDSVTSIGSSAFSGCTSLTSITIPNSVTSIGYVVFSGCTSLTSIDVVESNKSFCSKDGILFNKDKTELICYPVGKNDESYIVPDSVTSIGDYAFYRCTSLTSITIPDSVPSIGNYAFYCCSSLTSITIPDSVISIGKRAFSDCTSLKDIYYTGTESQWNAIEKSEAQIPENCTIHFNFKPDSAELSGVSVTKPTKTTYTVGDALDLTGGSLVLTYSDGSTRTNNLTENMLSGYDMSKAGKQTVTVTYENFTDTFEITINYAAVAPKVTATAGDGSVTLSWNAIQGATKYAINRYNPTTKKFKCLQAAYTDTEITIPELVNGYEYIFLVQSNVNGEWSSPDEANFVRATPIGKIEPVVTATPGDSEVTLSWTAINGATKYAINRYNPNTKKFKCLKSAYTGTEITISGLENGYEYIFLVQAYVNGTWSSADEQYFVKATPFSESTEPDVTATPGDGEVTLSWTAINGATKYAINRYNPNTKKFKCLKAAYTDTEITVSGLANGYEYVFLVQAYVNGAWSSPDEANFVRATPIGKIEPVVTATPGDGEVTLSWTAINGATKYAINRYNPNTKKFKCLKAAYTDTEITIPELVNGYEYIFLVQAYVNGTWSSADEQYFVYATPSGSIEPVVTARAGDGSVTLSWTAVKGATKYAINRYNPNTKKFKCLKSAYTGTEITISGLANGYEYIFLVQAYVNGTWSSAEEVYFVSATPKA